MFCAFYIINFGKRNSTRRIRTPRVEDRTNLTSTRTIDPMNPMDHTVFVQNIDHDLYAAVVPD